MRDLLVTKLASGEHIPRDGDASPVMQHIPTLNDWRDKVDNALFATIKFFDGPGGEEYARRYEANPIEDYVTGICRLVKDQGSTKRKALDIGCGPGQYAELLKNMGYEVELADASIQMLSRAHERLHKRAASEGELKLRHIENLINDYPDPESFDIIFACAMMIHVPRRKPTEVYRQFYRLIRQGGALFVNFKIGDHTLRHCFATHLLPA
jgi:2-polyprenyl-3-methyl-5-hydroxy-6-metoxy-1,4-benzoquinol methylase